MSSPLAEEAILAEIRAAMARRQRTRAELATAVGLGRGALQRRMTGEVPFRAPELAAIARFLEVPVSAFYEPAPTSAVTADAS